MCVRFKNLLATGNKTTRISCNVWNQSEADTECDQEHGVFEIMFPAVKFYKYVCVWGIKAVVRRDWPRGGSLRRITEEDLRGGSPRRITEEDLRGGSPRRITEEDHRGGSPRRITEEDHRGGSPRRITEEDHRGGVNNWGASANTNRRQEPSECFLTSQPQRVLLGASVIQVHNKPLCDRRRWRVASKYTSPASFTGRPILLWSASKAFEKIHTVQTKSEEVKKHEGSIDANLPVPCR